MVVAIPAVSVVLSRAQVLPALEREAHAPYGGSVDPSRVFHSREVIS